MLIAVYLPISDSEGFRGTDSICGTDGEDAASSESSPGYETSMPTPLIYEPSVTESDSSFEHSTSSDDSEDRLFQICHGKLKHDQPFITYHYNK